MKTIEELTNDVIEYEYELRPYEMKDCYNSKEDAYEDIYKILSVKPKGILNEIVEEINMLLKYEDLRNNILKRQYEQGCKLFSELNEYVNYFLEKDSDIEI